MQFAAIFPGQGSQSTGMLAELAEQYAVITQTFAEGSDILGKDLWKITQQQDATELSQTQNTQPAMLAAGIAVWRVWLEQGGCQPVAAAGHSLGEYSALVASGALDYADAMALVAKRASYMQQAIPAGSGAMAAILGLDDELIVTICADVSHKQNQVVEAVNFNSPGQVVIAGAASAVDAAIERLQEAGAKRAIKLAVSVPSHCSLMKDAAQKLDQELSSVSFSQTQFPVLQNIEAKSYETAAEKQAALSKQLYKPVKWVDTINNLHQDYAADSMIEFGPGKVLFGLNRRINRKLGNICISDSASLEKALKLCDSRTGS